jgi:polar amino acid transport system substrate-binding protein
MVIFAICAAGCGSGSGTVTGDFVRNCGITGKRGALPLTPAQAGQLTVQTYLPAPGWWNGDTPDTIKDGFEYCMAANIAYRAGIDRLVVVSTAWDALVAGQTSNFDLALAAISITPERKKVVDFSVPYFHSYIGVLAKKGAKIDSASMRRMRIGVQQASTAWDWANDTLKPTQKVLVFQDFPSLLASLSAGQIDVGMSDTAYLLALATQSKGRLEVIGQYESSATSYGAIYPKGSVNAPLFDKIIQSLIDDGTLKALSAKYLGQAWGSDPAAIPYFQVEN